MLTEYFEAYVRAYAPYKGGAWCYEDGCIYRGLELLHRATGEARWLHALRRRVDAQIGEGPSLAGYDAAEYNIDNVLPGRALLYLREVTGEARYLDLAGLLAGQLATHPRTQSGVYWHKRRYPSQVWLDGLYMGAPFQVAYGIATGKDALVDDAIGQVGTALDMTWEPATGLYAHAADEAREQRWADPETGRSPAHWARALGWLAMSLVDLAELAGPARFAPLRSRSQALLARISALRQPSGLWLQVIDRPDLPGTYEETSASAMFVYALLKGHALGLAEPEAGLMAALVAQAIRPKPGGGLEMAEICEVAGLGAFEGRFRDGSPEYYLTERRVSDDAKGVGPMMMAYAASVEAAARPEPVTARSSLASS
jgi:unsaturated rhamnogalacturonyl hydrolase